MKRLQIVLVPVLAALFLLVGEPIPSSRSLSSVVSADTIAEPAKADPSDTALRSLDSDTTPRAATLTGTLPTDDPPVNFRVSGTGYDWIGVNFGVPRNRGIASYEIRRYEHNGTEYVTPENYLGHSTGTISGGAGFSASYSQLKPDTLYKFTLLLLNGDDETVIQVSDTARTLARPTPGIRISFRPHGSYVTAGNPLTATISLSNLESDSDSSDIDYSFRADVVTQLGADVNACEGQGIGSTRNIYTVDQDPEVFTGVISTSCPAGYYNLRVSVKSAENVELASRFLSFQVGAVSATVASLSSLTLSNVPFTFNSGTTSYSVNVPSTVTETSVSATTTDSAASYVVKRGSSVVTGTLPLGVGKNTISVVVTAGDGVSTQTYAVTITRAAPPTLPTLRSLVIQDVPFTFSSATTSYSVNVAHLVDETIVRAATTNRNDTYVVKLGNVVKSGLFALAVGANVITIEVTAADGIATQTYTVTVTRAAAPTVTPPENDPPVNLRVSGTGYDWIGVNFEVPRNRGIASYEMRRYEHNGTEYVTPGNYTGHSGGTIPGGTGFSASYSQLKPDTLYKFTLRLLNANNEIVIQESVTARTQAQRTSQIKISLNPRDGYVTVGTPITATISLSSLESDSDSSDIDYAFRADVVTQLGADVDICEGQGIGTTRNIYTVDQDPEVFTGVISTSCPVGFYNLRVSLKTPADVELASTSRSFQIGPVLSTDATLSSLALSNVPFTFNSGTTSYSVNVPSTVEETTVTATTSDTGASFVVMRASTVVTGTLPLGVGKNTISVVVTAEDGVSTQTYTVTITRAAPPTLRSLLIEDVPLSFNSATTSYSVNVAHLVDETIVRAATTNRNDTYVVKLGNVVKSGLFALAVGANVITIEVTAADGIATQTYTVTVTVTRAAAPTVTPPENDPPVNLRVSGTGYDWIGVNFEVPRNRGIASYEMRRYEHNGTEYVTPGNYTGHSGGTIPGGTGFSASYSQLKPDTLYKFTLRLLNANNETVIQESVTARTQAQRTSRIEISFQPRGGYVTIGTPITVTISLSNLESDSDSSDIDYTLRADVVTQLGADVDNCEGQGIGMTRNIYVVDEDPESFTGSISTSCPVGYYNLKVSLKSAADVELASTFLSFQIGPALTVPALTAEATEGGVDLSWEAVQDAVRYELMAWWDAETGWQPIGGDSLTGTSYTHTTVTAGTKYFYTIRVVNAAGETSAWLEEYVSATARAAPGSGTPLTAPPLTVEATEGGVDLSWEAVQDAVRYELLTWWDAGTGWQPIGGDSLTGTSYTHTTVTAGTKYFYTIRVVNAAGETSAWLEEYVSATARAAPGSGTPLTAPPLTVEATEGGVDLSWEAVQDAVRYELMAWWDAETGWQPIGGDSLTGTSYTHTTVTAGTKYFYTIRVVNAAGETSAWLEEYVSATALSTQ